MRAFMIELDNKPGGLAKVTEAIASKGVNITAVSGATCGDKGRVAIATDNDANTRAALSAIDCSYEEQEITTASLRHEPGSLARAARRLADAGVNVDAVMPLGMEGQDIQVGFVTADPVAAASALSHASASSR